jgi:hypothetical protein
VVPPAVSRVVLCLEVSAFPTYSTPFVGDGIVGTGVDIVGEEEAPGALSVLYVRHSKFYHARFPIHIAGYM